MITITVYGNDKPSSERALNYARRLLASKKEMIEEIKNDAKNPEFLKAIEILRLRNEQ